MLCPLHDDTNRSASLNVLTGEWFCFAGCGGGGVADLIRAESRWVEPGVASTNGRGSRSRSVPEETITMEKIDAWSEALLGDEVVLDDLMTRRGIYTNTIKQFKIGWDRTRRVFTIPIFGHEDEIWNVRRYDLYNPDRKIWSVTGMRPAELYPVDQLSNDRIVICEGEWDCLVTIQNGYPCITKTAAAGMWRSEWSKYFEGKTVFLAHDCDHTGQAANRKIAKALIHMAADVRVVRLPYEIREKHGQDLSDFWQEYDRPDFERLLAEAPSMKPSNGEADDPDVVTVLETFDSRKRGEAVKVQVTIKGKKEPGYTIPYKAKLTCTRDAGAICQICPLNPAGGEAEVEIFSTNPAVLGLIEANQAQVADLIRQEYGAMKCKRLTIEIEEFQAVEILFARPSIDHADGTKAGDYKNLKITSAGRHDTLPNNTVVATGALYPNPRDQRNEFLCWDVQRQETSVDRFQVTEDAIANMRRFQPRTGQRPLKKMVEISNQLADHVTRIVGRPEMHVMMDLTFHAVRSFKFGGQVVHRGWLESLIVGDTRTGKSEAATRLVGHYGAGEIVGGESASLAGLVGGLQQIAGKDWAVTWGVIPINDRRLVVIDELSGLQPEDIAKMSDVRASGVARLTKIQQEVTFARTRLLWLGNPRAGGMDQFTYGVDAIRPLIGNPEDIARFDLAMALGLGDVPSHIINRPAEISGELRYTGEACHTLLMWAWTRQPDQIVWARHSEDLVFKLANQMGARYVEDPPLIQAANVRIKIARVAVAIAARTFSTDETCERIIVKPEHVRDAVTLIDHIYSMPSFGYADRSRERIEDTEEAMRHRDEIKVYLLERRGLAKFLRNVGKFRRQDLEEILNVDREFANAVINKLWESRMVRKDGFDVRVEPVLHGLLREVRW